MIIICVGMKYLGVRSKMDESPKALTPELTGEKVMLCTRHEVDHFLIPSCCSSTLTLR